MASESRESRVGIATPPGRLGHLFQYPYSYDFFQAVRLLRASQAQENGGTAGGQVRFRTLLSLGTPASAIYSLEYTSTHVPVMTVTFMGLTGPSGALPVRYTEMLLERRFRYKDQTAHHFFDLFNHRLIDLFYQAWQKHHIAINYEYREQDRFQRMVLSLIGLGTPGLQQRLAQHGIDDQTLVYFGGLLAEHARSVTGLRSLLSQYFHVPVEIEQFRGQWLLLSNDDCSRLGIAHCRLGQHPVLGKRVWECQSKFRVRVGPLKRQRFNDFLPTGNAYRALVKLVTFCVGNALEFDIQLLLERREISGCALTKGPQAARLGWTSWLKQPPDATYYADDVVLPQETAAPAALL